VRAFLKPFTLVVAANLPEQLLMQLAEACAVSFASTTTTTTTTTTLPLVSVRAYGFLGTVRCQYTKHEVVESKPDAVKPDLRIAQVPCACHVPILLLLSTYTAALPTQSMTTGGQHTTGIRIGGEAAFQGDHCART